ncbi:hypothetical protein [Thalassotalea euphylliae]|uniref:Uncharacterized protein n=1 Tax=Thalassotalea euphylliae TaxID=1655234 RepID=A0A3E0U5R2_9GAMM|nr:hypothetical protein [Thalassotalea euphylliae]REL31312.1 hypothetical protein DXX94_11650 [Thalassotalea euphylliae]
MLKLKAGQLNFPGLSKGNFEKGYSDIVIEVVLYDKWEKGGYVAGANRIVTNAYGDISEAKITLYVSGITTVKNTYLTLGHEIRHMSPDNREMKDKIAKEADAEQYGKWLAAQFGY